MRTLLTQFLEPNGEDSFFFFRSGHHILAITLSINVVGFESTNSLTSQFYLRLIRMTAMLCFLPDALRQKEKAMYYKYDIAKVRENVVDPMFTVVLIARVMDSLLIPLLLSLVSSAYVFLPIEETVTKSKKVQLMTGITSKWYWTSNFLIDFISYNIAVVAGLAPIYMSDPRELHKRHSSIIGTEINCSFHQLRIKHNKTETVIEDTFKPF